MWAQYLHHITVHFPLVLAIVLGAIGLWSWSADRTDQLDPILRWGGWAALLFAVVAVISGIVTAPGWFGGEGSVGLRHHRDMGLTSLCVIGFAVWSFEAYARGGHPDWRQVAVGLWCVAAFSVIGTAHWGGSELHEDVVPWLEETEAEGIDSEAQDPRP